MDAAVGKWEDDLDYVRHYRKPTRKVRVDAIKQTAEAMMRSVEGDRL
ncbi:MAG: hypothetical protein IJH04_02035 [Eggerthellaceae bacterium]|nr:hypothetical protein [Eggerthellaceae bacterium]